MKTMSYITGNLLFDGSVNIPQTATIKINILDVSQDESVLVYTKNIDFESRSLAVFRYLPFELKDFEHDVTRQYQLSVHVDIGNTGLPSRGDYVSKQSHVISTGLEEFNIQLVTL